MKFLLLFQAESHPKSVKTRHCQGERIRGDSGTLGSIDHQARKDECYTNFPFCSQGLFSSQSDDRRNVELFLFLIEDVCCLQNLYSRRLYGSIVRQIDQDQDYSIAITKVEFTCMPKLVYIVQSSPTLSCEVILENCFLARFLSSLFS